MSNKKLQDFKHLADNDKLSHAYFFFGSTQKEKFDFAVDIAKYLEKTSAILGECLIIESDEKGIIGINAALKINNFLYQKPVLSKKRTVIINGAENMTPEAQNAVLKTVEEPPQDALIIFIAQSEDSLLAPLASRLQKVYFTLNQPHKSALNQYKSASLEKIIENDKIDEYFEALIAELRKNSIKNAERLREVLKRLSAIKMFNVNKKLQLKALK